MGPGRPRTAIGTFGDFTYVAASNGKVKARVRFRDDDGRLRLVQATGGSRKSAERALREKLCLRDSYASGYGELSADSSFGKLVKVWLDDLDLENKLAPSTRALYERNMRQLVMPAFEHQTLREVTVRKVDQFIKTLAATKSYSTAKQARTVLSLAFGLAVRYDALRENPVRETARLRRPPSQAMALTIEQVESIRRAVRSWRRGPGHSGPPARWPVGADHRGDARHVCPDRGGAGDPQVRYRCHEFAGNRQDLRHHRFARRQADPSPGASQDHQVHPYRLGPEFCRRGAARAVRSHCLRRSRAPDLLQS